MCHPEDVQRHVYANEREHPDPQATNQPGETTAFGRDLRVPVLVDNQQEPGHESGGKVYKVKVVEEIERPVKGVWCHQPRTG